MLAGHHVTSRSTARRHQRAIRAALPYVVLEHRAGLETALARLNDRWGGYDGEKQLSLRCKHPHIADWFAIRRDRPRAFHTLQEAAKLLLDGETYLQRMRGWCFALSGQLLSCPVGYDAFREWLLRLGIARMITNGVYGPGPHAAAISQMRWPDVAAKLSGRLAQ